MGKVTLLILPFAPLIRIFIYNTVESATFEKHKPLRSCLLTDSPESISTAHHNIIP